jgi:type II secretory pathway pseudopilin PulG
MKKIKKKVNKKGIILIEALLALTVIVIVMTALVTALVSALSNTTYSNEQTQATAYAQEGIEIARAQKNSDFAAFQALNGTNCLGSGATSIPGSCSLIDGKFDREIYINSNGEDLDGNKSCEQANSIYVSSIVSWSDSRCGSGDSCHKVDLSSCFSNLNYIEAP